MGALSDSPLRLVSFVLAVVMIIPAGWLSLRHMLEMLPAEDSPRARALEAVWSIAPLVVLIVVLVIVGVQ